MSAENDSITKVHEFVAHSTEINCLSFGPKSHQVLATGGNDFKVNVWQVGNSSNVWTLGQNKSPVECLCFDAQEQYVVSGAVNGSIKVFDLNEGRLARNLSGHQVNTCSIQYHPYGEFIVSGSLDCSMKVWDVRNKSCIQTYSGHKKEITCVRFSPDGRWIASSGKDNKLLIWDLVAGKLLNTLRLDPAYVASFEFNPVEFIIGAVTSTRNVRLWDLDNMEPLSNTPSDASAIRSMAFSSDGNSVYTATKDSFKVFSWEPSAKLKACADIGWDKVAELRASADGTKIVAGSFNSNFVSIWNVDLDKIMNPTGGSVTKQRQSTPVNRGNVPKSKAVPLDNYNARNKDNDRENTNSPHNYNPDNNDYQADAKSFEKMSLGPSGQSGVSSSAKEEVTPVMQWASDEARDDMASSMTASFQKKLLEIQKQQQVSLRSRDHNAAAAVAASSGVGDGGNDSKSSDKRDNDAKRVSDAPPSSVEQLQSLLPPSRYNPSQQPHLQSGSSSGSGSGGNEVGQGQRRVNSSSSGVAFDKDRDREKEKERDISFRPPGQGQGPSDNQIPRRNSSSGGSGSVSGTPAPAGIKSHVPLKGISHCAPTDPRDRPLSNPRDRPSSDPRDRPLSNPRDKPRDARDGRDYLSYADIDVSIEAYTEVRGGLNGIGRKNISPVSPVSDIADTKGSYEDLRAAAKRAALATASPSSSSSSSDRHTTNSNANNGNQSSNIANRSEERNSHSNREDLYRISDQRPSTEIDRRELEADSLIDRMIRSSGSEAAGMSQRLSSIRILKRLWVKGDLEDVIEHMESLTQGAVHDPSQLVLLSDLLSSVELKGSNVTLQSCLGFMSILDIMSSNSERLKMSVVVCAVLKSFSDLLGGFGELIRSSKAMQMMGGGGVDLNREERLRKCNLCYNIIVKLKGKFDRIRQVHRIDYNLLDMLDRLVPLVDIVVSY